MKEIELPWNPEEDIAVYFTKLYKEQDRLKKLVSTGTTSKRSHRQLTRFTQVKSLTRRILSTGNSNITRKILGKHKKKLFKEIYAKQKRYKKAMVKISVWKAQRM